jgi:hypothetical protein
LKTFSFLAFLALAMTAYAQPPDRVIFVSSDPSGSCATGSALQWNSTSGNFWGCDSGTWTKLNATSSGTVTSITAGTGLSGGTITSSGTIAILTANLTRTCTILIGADNGNVLSTSDMGPQNKQCKVPFAATIVEMDIAANTGTPNAIVAVRHCTAFTTGVCSTETISNIVSGALAAAASNFDACSNTGGTTGLDGGTTCSSTLQNTSLAKGDYIELVSGAPSTASRVSINVIYTVN